MKITTGIRCVARSPETIWDTIESLKSAGFFDLMFFVDGRFPKIAKLEQHGVVLHRKRQVGAWPNFYLALAELTLREPAADYYLVVEDDVLFCKDVAHYLEQSKLPIQVASLFSSQRIEQAIRDKGIGFTKLNPGWRVSSGSQAFLFSAELALKFLTSPFVVNYRRSPPTDIDKTHYRLDGLHHVDCVLGRFCYEAGCGIQYHYPSLSQHTGEESFMYRGFKGKEDSRFSEHFPGEDVSALTFLE